MHSGTGKERMYAGESDKLTGHGEEQGNAKRQGLEDHGQGLLDFRLSTTETGSAGPSAEGSARGAELSKANGAGGRQGVCGPSWTLSSDH